LMRLCLSLCLDLRMVLSLNLCLSLCSHGRICDARGVPKGICSRVLWRRCLLREIRGVLLVTMLVRVLFMMTAAVAVCSVVLLLLLREVRRR